MKEFIKYAIRPCNIAWGNQKQAMGKLKHSTFQHIFNRIKYMLFTYISYSLVLPTKLHLKMGIEKQR